MKATRQREREKKRQAEHLYWNGVIFEAFEIIRKAIKANGGNLCALK